MSSAASKDRLTRGWVPILMAILAPVVVGFVMGLVAAPETTSAWLLWGAAVLLAATVAIAWLVYHTAQANTPLQLACTQLREEARVVLDPNLAWILTPRTQAVFAEMVVDVQSRFDALRQHRDELTRSRELLETVLQNMVEGVVVLDRQSRIAFVNQSARKLLRLREDELVQRPLWEVARYAELTRQIEFALETSKPTIEEIDLPQQRMIVRSACIPMELGNHVGAVLVLYDVTELRKLERQRREFVSNVSHELKTPLTAIQNYVDTLLDGAIDDQEHAGKFVAGIQEQCERLEDMIQELLRLSRIESGQEVFTPSEVSLGAVIAESIEAQRPAASSKSVTLEASSTCGETLLWTDHRALRTILDNLINNAVKYTPSGGQVVVAWQADEHEARIDVVDNGVGIPRDQLPRVFERFYRVDRSRDRAVGGTGLGLAIVKHLVEEIGGRVAAQSTLDRGSTFSVWLPLTAGESATQPEEVALRHRV